MGRSKYSDPAAPFRCAAPDAVKNFPFMKLQTSWIPRPKKSSRDTIRLSTINVQLLARSYGNALLLIQTVLDTCLIICPLTSCKIPEDASQRPGRSLYKTHRGAGRTPMTGSGTACSLASKPRRSRRRETSGTSSHHPPAPLLNCASRTIGC